MRNKKEHKEITVEKLARMTQRGFEELDVKLGALRDDMATKADIRQLNVNLHESEQRLLNAINGVEVKRPEFEALANDVEDLSTRVRTLEHKR